MALTIRNPETERLVTELVRETGENKITAITTALRDRLMRVQRERQHRSLADEVERIAQHFASLPVLDNRTPDEILGYDENGLPT